MSDDNATEEVTDLKEDEALEDEIIDPKIILERRCKETMKCTPFFERFNRCQQRVEGRLSNSIPTTETCQEELFDLSECVDQCVF